MLSPFVLAMILATETPPPEAGPIVRLPKVLEVKPGDLTEVTVESGAELVTWDASDGLRITYKRNDPAQKTVYIHTKDAGEFALVASIPSGKETRAAICMVKAGGAPRPPPDPPAPAGQVGFIVIVEETGEGVATRGALLADSALQARLKAKSIGWRVADRDVRGANGQPPADLVPYLNLAKGKKLPQVFLIGTDRAILFQGDLPAGASGLVQLLERYGG